MATKLTPDKTFTLNGVKINEFLLTKHNPNKISMPTATMNYAGVTVHNTNDLANVADDCEQYTRATYNGNMKDVRVHYYVDELSAWQNLPLTLQGWHAADGKGKGNTTTVAIECIMSASTGADNVKAEDNCARLAAWLLYNKKLGIDKLYTHTHWLNVKDGKTGTLDYLNTAKNSYKNCPAYILPHWAEFKKKVQGYLDELNGASKTTSSTTNSTSNSKANTTATTTTFKAKDCVKLNKTPLYTSATATKQSSTKTGTYYIYDGKQNNNRLKITTSVANCSKAGMVTGWVNVSDISKTTTSTPTTTTTTSSKKYFKKYAGTSCSIVEALNSLGEKSSYQYRSQIAKANSITLYIGASSQNTKMLTLLKQGKLIKP